MNKLYAQFNEEGICICVGTPKTDIEATYDCLGKKYINNTWIDNINTEKINETTSFINEDIIQKYCPICNTEIKNEDICITCGYNLA